jgi:O-antigen/teichoic acid export membrane protein
VSAHSSILKGGSHLVAGQLACQASSFVRNLFIARIISPADFGIAATFAMTLSLMEMLSNVAAEMLLVQSPDGDNPRLQNTAQLLRVGRGAMNAAILLALAVPMSRLFGVPQARWAFECLAIFPLANGFSHLDLSRVQREMRFGPSILVSVGSSVFVTIVAVPLGLWLRNYSVMLWLLVFQVVFTSIGSHLVAERRYGWAWDKGYVKRIFTFGWPLLINGLLMYGIFEGDRLVIGSADRMFARSHFTLADLGVYSVAFALTMAPTQLVANVSTSLFLPILSRAQEDRTEFNQRYLFSAQIISLVAMMITIPFILGGGWAVDFLYGKKYAAAAGFIGWLAAMWGIRMFRVAPTVAAIANGDTQNAMLGNVARSLALAGMLVVAMLGAGLPWIPVCGFGGELLALAATVWRLERRQGVPAMICLKPFAAFATGTVLAGLGAHAGIARSGPVLITLASLVLVGGVILAMFATFPNLRHDLRSLIHSPSPSLASENVALLD